MRLTNTAANAIIRDAAAFKGAQEKVTAEVIGAEIVYMVLSLIAGICTNCHEALVDFAKVLFAALKRREERHDDAGKDEKHDDKETHNGNFVFFISLPMASFQKVVLGREMPSRRAESEPIHSKRLFLSVSYSALQFHARINETIRNIDYEVRNNKRTRRRKPWCRKSWCNRNPECSARNTCRGRDTENAFYNEAAGEDACRDWAETVTTGMMALRIACLKIMPLWERPLP